MHRYALALDLTDDAQLIKEYEHWHSNIWPEIKQSIINAGVQQMEIYRYGTRLFMLMEVDDQFTFEAKSAADANNPKVQEWEALMWKYQVAVPGAKPGEKWVLMNRIFALN
ncbi:L-rhamnose mutarotase [bacterium A37T11]|nr:L-rhamnose mutarotase [bacterium A37T11]